MRDLVADRRQTLVDITYQFGLHVSHSTVRKALHEVGFHNRIAQKKPYLSDAHRRKRFEFASEYQRWTTCSEEWKRVIWNN